MSNIHNNEGITGYDQYNTGKSEGQIDHSVDTSAHPYVNPLLPQLDTVTAGGTTTAGVYSITIEPSTGVKSFTVSFTRVAEDDEGIRDALLALLQAVGGLRNIAIFTTGTADEDIDIEFLATDKEYDITLVAPSPGTLVNVNNQVAGGVAIPVGRFLVQDAANSLHAVLPGDATTGPLIRGVSGRVLHLIHNSGDDDADANESFLKGSQLPVFYKGRIAMKNVGGVAAVRGGLVHAVIKTDGGQELGQARSDEDSGNSVVLLTHRAEWAEDVAVNAIGWVQFRM